MVLIMEYNGSIRKNYCKRTSTDIKGGHTVLLKKHIL